MDAISYSYADKQAKRIKKFINDPDSTSGIITVPKVIASGENITVPSGRVAILPNVQIDGTLDVQGEVFIPSGATMSKVVEKVTSTDNSIVRFNGTTGDVQNSGVIIDDSNNVNTSGSIYSANMVGFKNYIINGNFDIWQYKDAGLTYPQTSSSYGSDDRWSNSHGGSTKTHSQVACTDTERALFNAGYFSRTVVTSVAGAGNSVQKYQQIENVNKLAGKTVTLSFWAKADSNKNIAIEFGQSFGTGGSPSSTITGIGSQLVSLTTTWQKKIITVTIPSIVGKTLGTDGAHTTTTYIDFWFDAGSSFNSRTASLGQQSGTFDIAQVQLEEGSVATPFENRPYGLELSLCQRYYEIGYVKTYVGTSILTALAHNFKTEKRIIPTITFLNSPQGVNYTPTIEWTDKRGFAGNRSQEINCGYTASAEL